MNERRKILEETAFLLEMASRNLMRAHTQVQSLDGIALGQIDRAVTASDEALYLVRTELKRPE